VGGLKNNEGGFTAEEIMNAVEKRRWGGVLSERELAACAFMDGITDAIAKNGVTLTVQDSNGRVIERRVVEKRVVN
jgi:hypothetical protein